MIARDVLGTGGWRSGGGTAIHGAGRRGWAGTVVMLAGTLAVALASYSISMTVSAERAAAERLRQQNVALERSLKSLEAERRVRMRLPQLERWNRDVLGLRPIDARQFLDSPLLLASYGTPVAGAPVPTLAVMREEPAAPPARAGAQLRTVAAARPAGEGGVAVDPVLLAAVAALADAPGTPDGGGRPQLTAVAMAQPGDAGLATAGGVGRR